MEHKRAGAAVFGVALAWALGLSACGDGGVPTALPEGGPTFAQVSGGRLQVVRRNTPLGAEVEVTVLVGGSGARIELPGVGVVLTVPPGAVGDRDDDDDDDDDRVPVTVRALPGRDLVLEFGPHGLRFRRPARLEVDLAGTEAEGAGSDAPLWVVYFTQGGVSGYVGLEKLGAEVSGSRLRVELRHFSGYLIAMG